MAKKPRLAKYGSVFYDNVSKNKRSSLIILKYLLENLDIKSVLDIGCGTGVWLESLHEVGVDNVIGVDGEWLLSDKFLLDKQILHIHDLRKPLALNRKFDLVISLEVAEHIEKSCSDIYINNLISHSELILFSCAIPFQGGTNHINEQWPDYWIKKFYEHDYLCIDFLRQKFWNNENIRWFYSQNIMVFAKSDLLYKSNFLLYQYKNHNLKGMRLIHPQRYLKTSDPANFNFNFFFRLFKQKITLR